MVITKSIPTRKITRAELYTLIHISANDKWHVPSLLEGDPLTKSIVIILSDQPIKATNDLVLAFMVMETESILLKNVENKELINFAEVKIFENSTDVRKYAQICFGIIRKSHLVMDLLRLSKNIFFNRSLISVKFDIDIAKDLDQHTIMPWISKNIKEVSFFSEEFESQGEIGPHQELDSIFSSHPKHIQICYFEKMDKGHKFTVMTSFDLEHK